jgi:hypothetical protein
MNFKMKQLWLISVLSLIFAGSTAFAQSKATKAPASADAPATTPLMEATQEFIAKTEELAQMQANEILGAELKVGEVRQLVNEGLLAQVKLQETEDALSALRVQLTATRQRVADARQMIVDTKAADELAKKQLAAAKTSAPLAGKSQSFLRPTIMRYSGASSWSLTGFAGIQNFFSSKFGRNLPTSAFGQSATHNQLGYDHRNAVDVALHPDSAEGQALIDYLRSQGIPFLAFRGAVPGVATGAHIHIGSPSHRLS